VDLMLYYCSFLERYPLPDDFTAEDTVYRNFIRYFGTHFFTTANFGGVLQVRA
jgi:hypothetical protein